MDDVHKTSSSLSQIINKQQQAYVSCEETQTLFDYYVSSLQANLKAPGDVQAEDSAVPKEELNKLDPSVKEGQNNDAVPLADFPRKQRQRYQSPLETIEEYIDHRRQEYQNECMRQTPLNQFQDPTRNAHSLPGYTRKSFDGTPSRLTNARNSKSGIRMLYHTDMWAPDDQFDHLHEDNASLMNNKTVLLNSNCKSSDVHTPARETNSLSESNRDIKDHLELMSKISKSDGNRAEACSKDNAVSSAQRTTGEEDGAITVMPKLSVVDIQRCHADRASDMKGLYHSTLQEVRSLQASTQLETMSSESTKAPVEKVEDMSSERGAIKKHSSRKDAEKHLDMVREKQQRAKELFTKLKSINNATIHNIALNSSMLLEASIKKVSLLSKSYSFEPEEVISSTTQMLEDLTNLISTTSNYIRQVAKSALAEGENLGIVPFLSGPRSISGMVSSTETLMSPVTFSTSSVEEDNRVSGIIASVAAKKDADSATMTLVKNMSAPTISGKETKITNLSPEKETQFYSSSDTDSEYEVFKSTDLISFVDNNDMMPLSCPKFVRTREPLRNIMDAALEELPGWKNTDNLMGAGEIINQWQGGESKSPGKSLSNQQYARNNGTINNPQTVTDGVPDRITMNNTPRGNDKRQSPNTSITSPERHATSSETFAEYNSPRQHVTQSHKISSSSEVKVLPQALHAHKPKPRHPTQGIQTRNSKPSPDKTATSTTQTANKSQQHVANMAYETPTKINVPRIAKDSTDTNNLFGPNKQLRNKSGQPVNQPGDNSKNDQKRKSNTLTVKSKETKHEYLSKTDKTMKPLPAAKKVQLANKTLHRNVINICEKINVLKSCVQNRNTCFEGKVAVEIMAAEKDICENLPLGSLFSPKEDKTSCNRSIPTSKAYTTNQGKSTQDTYTSPCGNKGKVNDMGSLKTPVSSPVVTKEIIHDNTFLKQGHMKGCNSNLQSKKRQRKNENHNSKFLPECNKHNQRPKRLMTHQEVQSWVNFSHQSHCRECAKHSKMHHKRCGSPNIKNVSRPPSSVGPKSARSNLRRSKSSSPSSCRRTQSVGSKGKKQGVNKPHVSDTSITSELGSTNLAGVERTASQLIIDTLADVAQVGIKGSLSANPGISLGKKPSEMSLKSAKEIVSKLSGCSDEESEHHSGIESTINRLVSSLDKTIDKSCDKRVCWDSSKDIPPRGKSSSEETESKIFETGSRVLGTIAAQLMRKLSIEAESTASRDDPETEVSYNSKRNWDLSSSSLEGLISDYSIHSVNGHNANFQKRMAPISHLTNVNKLMDVIKSTSDGYFSAKFNTNKRNVPPQMAEANHAMAALEDLQALLSSLKCSMGEQTRPPSRLASPQTPMRPKSKVKRNKTSLDRDMDASSSSEPEPMVEKCGDTIITTTVRAPVKRPSHSQSSPLPVNRLNSAYNSFATHNRTSNTSAVHSSSSRLSNATSTSCNSSLNSKSCDSDRSHSRLLPSRAGYRMPAVYANKSYGNLPSRPATPQQYSTPRNNQTQDRWGNRELDLTLNSRRHKSEMHCGNRSSDNESVVSSSSCYTNRMHQLAQPKKRYLEATKDEHKHVLKRQYLERLQKRINVADTKKARSPSNERRAKGHTRKQTSEEPIDNQEAGVAKLGSADNNKETVPDDESLVSVESDTDENISIHYNSPSDDSIVVGVNDRQYYHYSDKSDYSSAAMNTVQYGEIVYVSVDKKPNLETTHEFVDTPTQEVEQEAKFVTIDVDTWNLISQNCIANFQQDDQTFFIQTAIPPQRHNEVSILEVTDSQEDVSVKGTTQQESKVLSFGVQRELKEMPHLSNTEKELCAPNVESTSIDYLSVLMENKIVDSPSELSIANMDDAGEESVDGIIFSVMEGIINKAAVLCDERNRNSSFSGNDSQNLSDSDFAITESVPSDQEALATKWDELNDSNRGKKYHPKRSIQNEVSIELEDYDSKTMFNIVKQYLSSESESEKNCSREILEGVEDTSELHKVTPHDACALYELFSDDSDSIDELSQYDTAMSKSVVSEMSLVSGYSSALDTRETSPVCNVKLCNDVDLASGQIVRLNTISLKDDAKADVEGRTPGNVATNSDMLLEHGKSDRSDCDTEYGSADQSFPGTKASAESQNISQPIAQRKWVDGDHTTNQSTSKEHCIIGDTVISQTAPGLMFDELHNTEVQSQYKGKDYDIILDGQTESVPDGSMDGNTNTDHAERDATQEHKRYPKMFNLDNPKTNDVKPPNKTLGVGIKKDDCVTHQNNSMAYESSAGVSVQHLDYIRPQNQPSSDGDDSTAKEHKKNRLTLDSILPPDSREMPASFDDSVSSIVFSRARLTESMVEPTSEAGSCIVLPVLDLTSVDTVSCLLGALTHVAYSDNQADSDTSLSHPSMDSLLKQFSNVVMPGDQERHVATTNEGSLDSLLDSLALLPQPIYHGMYSSCSIRLRGLPSTVEEHPPSDYHPLVVSESVTELRRRFSPLMPNIDTPIICGNLVTRSVQTDLDLNWRPLSVSEIHLGFSANQTTSGSSESSSSSNTVRYFGSKAKSESGLDQRVEDLDEEIHSSVSSPGLLLDTDVIDLPYVSDAERQSVMDLAIYTDVLKSYSTQEKLDELLATLDALMAEDEAEESADGSDTLEGGEIASNRRAVIMSLVTCVMSLIMFGVFFLPNVYDLRNS